MAVQIHGLIDVNFLEKNRYQEHNMTLLQSEDRLQTAQNDVYLMAAANIPDTPE